MQARSAEQTRSVVERVVEQAGFDLDELVVTPAGKRRLVRVVLDKDGGVTLDECAEVSRDISRVLDDSDVMGSQPYTLEISSRGVSKPLTLPRHWRRSRGRLVVVTTSDGAQLRARIVEADEERTVLDVDGDSRELSYDDVAKAVVQVELNRPTPAEEA